MWYFRCNSKFELWIWICYFSEFPTSQLEMEKVANLFDRDGSGMIDYKEFVAALRPDREVGLLR